MSLFPGPVFDQYWAMWNETDPALVRGHLDNAVTEGFVFCDPLHHHVGRDALEQNVLEVRAKFPHAVFRVVSGVDHHHDRCRYEWQFTLKGRVVVAGFDAVRIADSGLLDRIDGFFGPLKYNVVPAVVNAEPSASGPVSTLEGSMWSSQRRTPPSTVRPS